MGWMKRKSQDQEPSRPAQHPQATSERNITYIAQGVVIEGVLRVEQNVEVAGLVKGEVHCDGQITIARGGALEGDCNCGSILIHGEVRGDLHARDRVTIADGGTLIGDITTRSLAHEPGGFFQGYSHMLDTEQKKAGAPEPESAESLENEG